MNWLSLVQLVPMVIIGIQQMHKDINTPGTTKRQLALEALGLAGTTATNLLTGDNAAYAGVATQLAGGLIDQFTQAFKATNSFGFTKSTTDTATGIATPVPAPPASTLVATVGKA